MKPITSLFTRLLCLSLLLSTLPFSLSAQEGCQSPVFFEGEPESGFCSGPLPNCTIVLGTTITQSSQLPAAIISGTICIQGNFTISTGFPLTFINATVLIAPEVEITVDQQSTFRLNNASLHGCNGLWKGIKLLNNASIFTLNQTVIEDARKAINAAYVSANISVENTTFNRNINGIWLEDVENAASPPHISNIYNSNFICNAPITGTVKDISDHGIYSINCPVSFVQGTEDDDHHVVFRNLKYGIRVLGNRSIKLKGNNFSFHQIRYACIDLRRGEIDFEDSEFVNYGDYGIAVGLLRDLTLSGCDFRLIETDPEFFPAPSPVFRSALRFNTDSQFPNTVNPQVIIHNGCTFIYDCPSVDEIYTGILVGGIANRFDLKIINNEFQVNAQSGRGIHLEGGYLPQSTVEILTNEFTVRGPIPFSSVISQSYGIYAQFQINNMHIVGNSFYGSNEVDEEDSGIYSSGINLYTAQGFNNQIIDNYFFGSTTFGVYIYSSSNWNICSNFLLLNLAFYFHGDNLGINFTQNEMVFGNLFIDGKIFLQEQRDNAFFGGIFKSAAVCLTSNCVNSSKFLVRQPINSQFFPGRQFYGNPPVLCLPVEEFFKFQSGNPPEACASEFQGPGDNELLLSIAQNTIENSSEYPSKEWLYRNYLYAELKNDSSLSANHSSYSTFLQNAESTSLGQFFNVKKLLHEAYLGTSTGIDMGKVDSAIVLNNGIVATTLPEENQKTVNQIQLDAIFNNKDTFSVLQIIELRQIASQCFKDGGIAVAHASSLLNECDKLLPNINHNCGSLPTVFNLPIEEAERNNRNLEASLNSSLKYVNDGGMLTIFLPDAQTGMLRLFDMAGNERFSQKVLGNQRVIQVNTSAFSSGIYIISFSGDVNEVSKVLISH